MQQCLLIYKNLIEKGVAPEQARMVLPRNDDWNGIGRGTLYASEYAT